jgi:hypothetical protein
MKTSQNTESTIDVFNVLDYGADPTGVADATTPVRNALAAANANVIATGRPTTIFVPAGNFKFLVKTVQQHIDINNMTKLSFVGVDGNRSKFTLQGDAGLGDWYMFNVRGNSSDIEFRKLWLDMNITNPDPAEQNHLIQVGNTGATNVRIFDCTFNRAVGDGIRLAGEFGTPTNEITVRGCVSYNCSRAFVSVQRWCQRVTVTDCTMYNGNGQQIDFEPTGYALTATGGNATTVIDATAQFVTWGIQAGDQIFNVNEDLYARVVSVDSQTQLRVTAGAVDWNGDTFGFLKHCTGHQITNNRFIRGTNVTNILLTLEAANETLVANNYIEGSIHGIDCTETTIANNHLVIRRSDDGGVRCIEMFKSVRNVLIVGNQIWAQTITQTTLRQCISAQNQTGRTPHSVKIQQNLIYATTRATGVIVQGARRCEIKDNVIVLNTPGETNQSVGIYVHTAAGLPCESAIVTGNDISAEQGQWVNGVFLDVLTGNMTSVILGGGSITDCSGPALRFLERGGGVFVNPLVMIPTINDVGSITPPASRPWLVIGGVGGSAPTTTSLKPQVFWGQGSPEGVVTAGVGSVAHRSDGGAGTSFYVKESGTGNTGWVPK